MNSHSKLPEKLLPWAEARRRHRLSDAHVQMARELGMNPGKLGKLDNHKQEPWKAPLPDFIARLYLERFGREGPVAVCALEEIAARQQAKKAECRATRLGAKSHSDGDDKSGPARSQRRGQAADWVQPETNDSEGPPWF